MDSRKPSLDNAYARVSRAKQHLARLNREIAAFGRSNLVRSIYEDVPAVIGEPYEGKLQVGAVTRLGGPTTAPSTTSTTWADIGEITGDITYFPPRFSILIGECIYNLRASLDYLIYELAVLDSGEVQKGTQFLIEDRPEGWNGRYGSYLNGLSSGHQAILESLQPYRGCNWTGILRDLSNPDKHRHLLIGQVGDERIRARIRTANSTRSSAGTDPMQMDVQVIAQVTFDDGSPVKETLQELVSEVTDVLDVFSPEFK